MAGQGNKNLHFRTFQHPSSPPQPPLLILPVSLPLGHQPATAHTHDKMPIHSPIPHRPATPQTPRPPSTTAAPAPSAAAPTTPETSLSRPPSHRHSNVHSPTRTRAALSLTQTAFHRHLQPLSRPSRQCDPRPSLPALHTLHSTRTSRPSPPALIRRYDTSPQGLAPPFSEPAPPRTRLSSHFTASESLCSLFHLLPTEATSPLFKTTSGHEPEKPSIQPHGLSAPCTVLLPDTRANGIRTTKARKGIIILMAVPAPGL